MAAAKYYEIGIKIAGSYERDYGDKPGYDHVLIEGSFTSDELNKTIDKAILYLKDCKDGIEFK